MEQRALGRSGVEVTRIILGCGNFGGIGSAPEFFGRGEDEEAAFRIMDAAWRLGVRSFDTADAYGGGQSETFVGNWIASRRHRPQITTKTYNPMAAGEDRGLSRERVLRQIESSLDRLGIAHVDLYLAHEFDPDTPLDETIGTFEQLVDAGLIEAYGVSNFGTQQLRSAVAIGRPAVVQNSYSLLERGDEEELFAICEEFDVAYTPFSPLAGGWLTGKYTRDRPAPPGSRMTLRPEPYEHLRTDRTYDAIERFVVAAERRGVEPATLAIAWVLAQPAVTAAVIGPRSAQHVEAAVRAIDEPLTSDEAAELAALF